MLNALRVSTDSSIEPPAYKNLEGTKSVAVGLKQIKRYVHVQANQNKRDPRQPRPRSLGETRATDTNPSVLLKKMKYTSNGWRSFPLRASWSIQSACLRLPQLREREPPTGALSHPCSKQKLVKSVVCLSAGANTPPFRETPQRRGSRSRLLRPPRQPVVQRP